MRRNRRPVYKDRPHNPTQKPPPPRKTEGGPKVRYTPEQLRALADKGRISIDTLEDLCIKFDLVFELEKSGLSQGSPSAEAWVAEDSTNIRERRQVEELARSLGITGEQEGERSRKKSEQRPIEPHPEEADSEREEEQPQAHVREPVFNFFEEDYDDDTPYEAPEDIKQVWRQMVDDEQNQQGKIIEELGNLEEQIKFDELMTTLADGGDNEEDQKMNWIMEKLQAAPEVSDPVDIIEGPPPSVVQEDKEAIQRLEAAKKRYRYKYYAIDMALNQVVRDTLNSRRRKIIDAYSVNGVNQMTVEKFCANDFKLFSFLTQGDAFGKIWFYKDRAENVQGPYMSFDMDIWNGEAQFFSPELLISPNNKDYRKLKEMAELGGDVLELMENALEQFQVAQRKALQQRQQHRFPIMGNIRPQMPVPGAPNILSLIGGFPMPLPNMPLPKVTMAPAPVEKDEKLTETLKDLLGMADPSPNPAAEALADLKNALGI